MTSSIKLELAAALAILPVTAFATPVYQARCSADSLDASQAEARVNWARRCGLALNTSSVGSYVPTTTGYYFSGDVLTPAPEYFELNPDHAYSSQSIGGVNYVFANSLYGELEHPSDNIWRVTQDEVTSPTPGYWRWDRSATKRSRPYYPTFNTSADGYGTQLYPPPTLSMANWDKIDCHLYVKIPYSGMFERYTGGRPTERLTELLAALKGGGYSWQAYTGNFYVSAYCTSGCYTPDQSLRFSDGDVNIVTAMQARRDDLVTLTADATLDDPRTQIAPVHSYTAEIREVENPIIKVTTASGGSLSVTTEHPVLVSDGRLVKAEALRKGQELLKADGTPDRIVQIEKTRFFGKVYNLQPLSTDPVANVLIAQGFLVGSGRFQNEDLKYMNRVLLFRAVPDAIMPR